MPFRATRYLSLVTTITGGIASGALLRRRLAWEDANRRVAICLDGDDMQAAAIRAGLSRDGMLARVAASGATHVSLPEWTLDRLLEQGALTPLAPSRPRRGRPPIGHWNYLHGDGQLVAYLATELATRLPSSEACVLGDETLVFAGDRPTVGELGLGFDGALAAAIADHGLGVVPRPVSYAWPEKALLERTLAQAGQFGPVVAFGGDMILGHEMHLDETVAAMAEHDLSLAYFAQSRHQKGDWFIAKRRAPSVILAHQMSPAEMKPLDYHAAVHNWVHLAQERGIRLCYVNFFRVLHATAPLEGLDYLHHLKHALEDAGFRVDRSLATNHPLPDLGPEELAGVGLAAAGTAVAALDRLRPLPDHLGVPLAIGAAAGATLLPFAEQRLLARPRASGHDHHHAHDHHHDLDHHHDHAAANAALDLHAVYPPSYTPKLLALATTALAPIALSARDDVDPAGVLVGWLADFVQSIAAGVALSAATSGQAYQLRIEAYRAFGLDWSLPAAAVAWRTMDGRARWASLAGLAVAWRLAARRDLDLFGVVDPGHAVGHTHHISAAMRRLGDIAIAVGPRPARKWAGLAPLGSALGALAWRQGYPRLASLADGAAVAGASLALASYRRPERALRFTTEEALPGLLAGVATGLLALVAAGPMNRDQ